MPSFAFAFDGDTGRGVYEQLARVPVRTARAGVRIALWDDYGQRAVQTIGLVTVDQRERGVDLDADLLISLGGDEAAAQGAP